MKNINHDGNKEQKLPEIKDPIAAYLKEISKYYLAPDAQIELFKEAKNGSKSARERVIKANLLLVVSIAKKFHAHNISFWDLIDSGNEGLIKAFEKYNPDLGIHFSTYAYPYIQNEIGLEIKKNGQIAKLGIRLIKSINHMLKVEEMLLQELLREPTNQEIADRMNQIYKIHYTERKIEWLKVYYQDVGCLDDFVVLEHEPIPLINLIKDPKTDVFEECYERIFSEHTKEILNLLEPLEKEVVMLRFGFDNGGKLRTHEEIGELKGFSRETSRIILKRALDNLYKYGEYGIYKIEIKK